MILCLIAVIGCLFVVLLHVKSRVALVCTDTAAADDRAIGIQRKCGCACKCLRAVLPECGAGILGGVVTEIAVAAGNAVAQKFNIDRLVCGSVAKLTRQRDGL